MPGFESLGLPDDQNIFVGGLSEGTVYGVAAWDRCCKGSVSLAWSCYPWCEIPDDYTDDGQDENQAASSMTSCLGFVPIYGASLNDGQKAGVGLTGWAVVSLVLATMALN
jgi:hypothetical protein